MDQLFGLQHRRIILQEGFSNLNVYIQRIFADRCKRRVNIKIEERTSLLAPLM